MELVVLIFYGSENEAECSHFRYFHFSTLLANEKKLNNAGFQTIEICVIPICVIESLSCQIHCLYGRFRRCHRGQSEANFLLTDTCQI